MEKYLSETSTNLRNMVDGCKYVCKIVDKDLGVGVYSKPDIGYYQLKLGNEKQLHFRKEDSVVLKPIVGGPFQGNLAIIQTSKSKENSIYLVYSKGYVELAQAQKMFSQEEIEQMFSLEYISRLTAKSLNVFDVSRKEQSYQFFCERLPEFLFLDESKNFEKSVYRDFKSGELLLLPEFNSAFINKQMCKQSAWKYFSELASEKRSESENGAS